MRTIPKIELGDVFFGWNIGYECPQGVWERLKHDPNAMAMPHEVPVPGTHHWDGWVVLAKYDSDIVLLAPILFRDLSEYDYLGGLDEVEHRPVEVRRPFQAMVLLGRTIHRTAEDLAGRTPALQRQLSLEDVKALRKSMADMLRNG